MTHRELLVTLGGKEILMSPGLNTRVDPEKGANGVLDFALAYRDEADAWKVVQRSVYRYRLRRREIIFIKEDTEIPGKFHTLAVVEYMPDPRP